MLKHKVLYLLLLFISLFFIACTSQASPAFECTDVIACVKIAPDEAIKLGVIQTLSGAVGPNGTAQLQTIKMAMADRDNMLLGHPIELQVEDEQCTAEGGANAALRILGDSQVVGILGTTCSNGGIVVAEMMSEAGMVMVSGSNSAASLTAIGNEKGEHWQDGYFRTVYNGAEEGRAAAIFAFEELGIRKAATINSREAYSLGLTNVFEQTFRELGGEVVLSAVIDPNDPNMMPVLESVASAQPEMLFFPVLNPSSIYIIQEARGMPSFDDIVLQTVEGVIIGSFIDEIGEDGIGIYFTTPNFVDTPALAEISASYEALYGEQPAHAAFRFAYDASNMLLAAIEQVATQAEDGTLYIPRQALREALYATKNFEGITGQLTCNAFGDCSDMSFNIVRLDEPSDGIEGLYNNIVFTVGHSE